MTIGKSPSVPRRGGVGKGWIVVASVLLVGVMVMGYGYFQQSEAGLYAGVAVIVAGVVTGLVRLLSRGEG